MYDSVMFNWFSISIKLTILLFVGGGRHKDFPHSRGPLNVHLVGGKPTDESLLKAGDYNPYKIFAAPIPDEIITNNEAIGDFFSQWGLVAMVQKGAKGYCFILYVCNDGALRILNEPSVVFHGKQLDVKPATIKNLDNDFTYAS